MAKNLTISEAAAKARITRQTVYKRLTDNPELRNATRKVKGRTVFPPAAMAVLTASLGPKRKKASPKAAKKKGKQKASPKASPKAAPPKPASRKTRRKAGKVARIPATLPGSVYDALNEIAATVGKAVNQSTVELKTRLRGILLAQRDLIDKALKELG